MVQNKEIPFNRGLGQQRTKSFHALAQASSVTAISFRPKLVVPVSKRLVLVESKNEEVVSDRKNVPDFTGSETANSVKQLGSGTNKRHVEKNHSKIFSNSK